MKRKRRTQIQKSNWFAEKNSKLRTIGKKYYGRRKDVTWIYEIPREPRTLKNRCQCKETARGTIKCPSFTEEDRLAIFKAFWNVSWSEKRIYLDGLVTSLPVKRPRNRKDIKESRRGQSLVYYLKKQDEQIKVFRTMFLNTLGIGRWTVLNWKNKQSNITKQSNASRALQQPDTEASSSKPFATERQELDNFFESLPVMESHYCRATTQKKYLLPEWTTKQAV